MKAWQLIIGILISIAILTVISCSPSVRYSVLTTLFDGVPEKSFSENDSLSIVELEPEPLAGDSTIIADNNTNNLFQSIHPPYRRKQCVSCHDFTSMGKLHLDQPALCLNCHEDLSASKDYVHGPAIGGHCTSCHSPHRSELETLLLNSGKELCLNCHQEESIARNKVHQNEMGKDCSACHDPHQSDTKFLIRSGVCTNCHEEVTENYAFVHGPIGGEFCGKCHEGHLSSKRSQLVTIGANLCTQCHVQTQVTLAHEEDISNSNCTSCHNPHGGNNKFMIREIGKE